MLFVFGNSDGTWRAVGGQSQAGRKIVGCVGAARSSLVGVASLPGLASCPIHTLAALLPTANAGNTLRQLVYDTICDGSLLPPPPGAQQPPGPLRQALSTAASFLASGLIHEGIFW